MRHDHVKRFKILTICMLKYESRNQPQLPNINSKKERSNVNKNANPLSCNVWSISRMNQ